MFETSEVGEFVDEVESDDKPSNLKEMMQLGRQIDKGGAFLAKAIAEFPKFEPDADEFNPMHSNLDIYKNKNGKTPKPRLRKLVATRIGHKLDTLSSSDFFIIVDELARKERARG